MGVAEQLLAFAAGLGAGETVSLFVEAAEGETESAQNLSASSLEAKALEPEPSDLCCPITRELFVDPVSAADGETYERAAIEAWIAKSAEVNASRREIALLQHNQVCAGNTRDFR